MKRDTPDPEIVSRIFNLDLGSLLEGGFDNLKRRDGSPATPEDVEAMKAAQACDLNAARDLWQHAMDQADFELDRQQRISALFEKYARPEDGPRTRLNVIEARMTPEDRAELGRLWDDLGGVMLLRGPE